MFKRVFTYPVVKLSVVNSSMISLVALMLPSLLIIGPVIENVSNCSRKLSFPTLNPKKKSVVTKWSSTH